MVPTPLRPNDYCALHTQLVVKSAYIWISPRLFESHAEPRDAHRQLSEPSPLLRRGNNEA